MAEWNTVVGTGPRGQERGEEAGRESIESLSTNVHWSRDALVADFSLIPDGSDTPKFASAWMA